MTKSNVLKLPSDEMEPPAGRLVDAATIAQAVFNGQVSARWVRLNCPRVQLSPRKVLFLEADVRAWVAKQRQAS